jgi:hypothetical protein
MNELQPIPALEPLSFLIGRWSTEGATIATGSEPAGTFKGTDTYEWVLEGGFMLHTVDVMMGYDKTEVLEYIGYDEERKLFTLRSFDNKGVFSEMHAVLEADRTLVITGNNIRARLLEGTDGDHMQAQWERSEDGTTWVPWMKLQLRK